MKKLALMALVGSLASFASASELWWMVADNATVVESASGTPAFVNWDKAYLCAATTEGYNFGGQHIEVAGWSKTDMADWGFATTDLTGYESITSFYVELRLGEEIVGNSYVNFKSDNLSAQGATMATDLAGARYSGGMSMASPYSFTQFTTSQVVPEPTSGLLMLLGFAGLALRRKRA